MKIWVPVSGSMAGAITAPLVQSEAVTITGGLRSGPGALL